MSSESALTQELLQYQIVSALFARTVRHEVVLKGGLALRALYGSQRATQDIDLQQDSTTPLARLQRQMRAALKEALAGGLLRDPVITEPKQTDTVARWKVNGTTAAGSHIHLTIEVSRRGLPPSEALAVQPMRSPEGTARGVLVDTYTPGALAATKVWAFLDTIRVAPRDLYDLDLLIRMEAVPPKTMLAALRTPEARARLYEKSEAYTYALFRTQVLPHLPPGEASRWTEEVFETMKVRVTLAVAAWLEDTPEESVSPGCAP